MSAIVSILLIKFLIHRNNVIILLLSNCYIAIFGSSLILLINCIYMLKGDYEIYLGQETFSCRMLGSIFKII